MESKIEYVDSLCETVAVAAFSGIASASATRQHFKWHPYLQNKEATYLRAR